MASLNFKNIRHWGSDQNRRLLDKINLVRELGCFVCLFWAVNWAISELDISPRWDGEREEEGALFVISDSWLVKGST